MSDRVLAAVLELVAALREEMAPEPPRQPEPDRLLSVEQAAELLGVGRTALYAEIQSGRCRSLKVGRRRLVPASAIAGYSQGAAGAQAGEPVVSIPAKPRPGRQAASESPPAHRGGAAAGSGRRP